MNESHQLQSNKVDSLRFQNAEDAERPFVNSFRLKKLTIDSGESIVPEGWEDEVKVTIGPRTGKTFSWEGASGTRGTSSNIQEILLVGRNKWQIKTATSTYELTHNIETEDEQPEGVSVEEPPGNPGAENILQNNEASAEHIPEVESAPLSRISELDNAIGLLEDSLTDKERHLVEEETKMRMKAVGPAHKTNLWSVPFSSPEAEAAYRKYLKVGREISGLRQARAEYSDETEQEFPPNEPINNVFAEDASLPLETENQEASTIDTASFLAYQDGDFSNEEKLQMLEWAKNSENAKKYTHSLEELFLSLDIEAVKELASRLKEKMLQEARRLNLTVSPYGESVTWAMWDIAKQHYYTEHREESGQQYHIANPFESQAKCDEIVNRQLGWEVYKAYRSDSAFRAVLDAKNPSIATYELLRKAPKESNGTLSSHELAKLGESVRDL